MHGWCLRWRRFAKLPRMTTAVLIKLAFVVIVVIAGLAKKAQENAQKQAAARKSAEDALRASMQPSSVEASRRPPQAAPTSAVASSQPVAKRNAGQRGSSEQGDSGLAAAVKIVPKIVPRVVLGASAKVSGTSGKARPVQSGVKPVAKPASTAASPRGGAPSKKPAVLAKGQAKAVPPSAVSSASAASTRAGLNPRVVQEREEADALQSRAKVAASIARVHAAESMVRSAHVRGGHGDGRGGVQKAPEQPRMARVGLAKMTPLRAPHAHALRELIADRSRLREAFLLGEVLGSPGGVSARSQP